MAVDDSYSKALLHFDGDDEAQVFTDESGKTWTAAGNTKTDTAQKVFGVSSGYFDGVGDSLYSDDSADWQLDGGSNSNEWTIDLRIRPTTVTGARGIIEQHVDTSNLWSLNWGNATGKLQFIVVEGGSVTINITQTWTPSANTWYHVAIVKQGATGYLFFVDGTQIGATATDTSTMPNLAAPIRLGTFTFGGTYYIGWMDELRISKGIARWTSNFTPPDAAYAPSSAVFVPRVTWF